MAGTGAIALSCLQRTCCAYFCLAQDKNVIHLSLCPDLYRYPIALLQSYPENEVCSNGNGDLIYGHVPLDANITWRRFLTRPLAPKTRGAAAVAAAVMPPAELARAAAIYPVVMLRDPLERVVSFANFLNIDQAVFEKFPERLACNQQTSMINGVPGTGGGCGAGVLPGATDLWSSFKHLPGSCNHNQRAAITMGQQRLVELFYFVGITEDFVGSMYLLQRTFGWGASSVQMAFQKSMKSFCDGECKKRFKVSSMFFSLERNVLCFSVCLCFWKK